MQADQPLAPIVWFRAGGPAEILAMPADMEDLAFSCATLPEEVAVTVIGLGSNLLVRDGGVDGVVVRLSARGFGGVTVEGNRIKVGAAMADKRLAAHALDAGIGGFAFYHGIPGAIGGALRMNAGANGVETRERVVEIVAIDRRGERHVLTNADMGYTYRHSAAPDDLIFVEATYEGALRRPREDSRRDGCRAGASRDRAAGEDTHRRLDLQESGEAQRPGSSSTPPAVAASRSATRKSPRCTAIS